MKQFMKLKEASAFTGLTVHWLRYACKAGTIPFIKSGTVYLVNMPLLMEQLNADSMNNTRGGKNEQV